MFKSASVGLINALKENCTEYKQSTAMGGYQYLAMYPNGFGVSIIKHFGSYGADYDLWEAAVMKGGLTCYDTDITCDVVGFLRDEDAVKLVQAVQRLDVNGKLSEDDPYLSGEEDEGV